MQGLFATAVLEPEDGHEMRIEYQRTLGTGLKRKWFCLLCHFCGPKNRETVERRSLRAGLLLVDERGRRGRARWRLPGEYKS
jgi:hypothetical protein